MGVQLHFVDSPNTFFLIFTGIILCFYFCAKNFFHFHSIFFHTFFSGKVDLLLL
jgi:hypothetical protein